MKTGTIKTLGAAVLGVAFAATAAGSANAAETGVPALPTALPAADPTASVGQLSSGLPVEQVSKVVPGAEQATNAVKGGLGSVSNATPAATRAVPLAGGQGLLGGLPLAGNGSRVEGLGLGG